MPSVMNREWGNDTIPKQVMNHPDLIWLKYVD